MSLVHEPEHVCDCFYGWIGKIRDWDLICSSTLLEGHPPHDPLWSPILNICYVLRHKVGRVEFSASMHYADGIQTRVHYICRGVIGLCRD